MNLFLWFIVAYLIFMSGVAVGMGTAYFAWGRRRKDADADAAVIDHQEVRDRQLQRSYMEASPTSPQSWNVPKNNPYAGQRVEGDAEIIDRPDASRLEELEEDDSIRESKAAVAETLKQFPSVQEILAARRRFERSADGRI